VLQSTPAEDEVAQQGRPGAARTAVEGATEPGVDPVGLGQHAPGQVASDRGGLADRGSGAVSSTLAPEAWTAPPPPPECSHLVDNLADLKPRKYVYEAVQDQPGVRQPA
jgi:hypothetical protein